MRRYGNALRCECEKPHGVGDRELWKCPRCGFLWRAVQDGDTSMNWWKAGPLARLAYRIVGDDER